MEIRIVLKKKVIKKVIKNAIIFNFFNRVITEWHDVVFSVFSSIFKKIFYTKKLDKTGVKSKLKYIQFYK